MPLIPADASFLLWSVVVALVGFGFWSEQNTGIGRYMTGIIVAMVSAMVLANIGFIPFSSPVYDSIFGSILPMAIPLMLFRADLVAAFRTGGPTVIAFGIGSVGILIGAYAATLIIPLGDLSSIAAGLYTATYTGGSTNFAATALAADFNNSAALTSMIAVDIVATNLQTMLLVALPGIAFAARFFVSNPGPQAATEKPTPGDLDNASGDIDLAGAAFAIAIALFLVFLGKETAGFLERPSLGVVFTTIYALLISNFLKPVVRMMSHDFDIAIFLIFLFLVALAAGADVASLASSGFKFFLFAMVILFIHTAFIMIVGRAFGLDLRSIVIGSTACVGGVTSATAIASAKGWRDLIIPGIMAGTIGNSFGTLLGVWIWSILS